MIHDGMISTRPSNEFNCDLLEGFPSKVVFIAVTPNSNNTNMPRHLPVSAVFDAPLMDILWSLQVPGWPATPMRLAIVFLAVFIFSFILP